MRFQWALPCLAITLSAILFACSSDDDGGSDPTPAQGGSAGSAQGGSGGGGQAGNAGAAGSTALKVTCTQSEYSCTCTANSKAEPSGTCTTEDVGGGICCTTAGYPNTDVTSCQCKHWGCQNATGTMCSCGVGSPSEYSAKACSAEHTVCCKGGLGRCTCWKGGECLAGETKVTNCEAAKAEACIGGQTPINTCTL